MELDDLKQIWKENIIKKPVNKNIMEMIQDKSRGPVAALKRSYRKQMVVMIIMPLMLLVTNLNNIDKTLTSILYWSYVAFCLSVIAFARYNYRIADKMQGMDGMVKSNVERQITLLETRLKWKIIGLRLALLFFIALTEILPFIQHYRMLDKWHSLPILTRYSSYAALLIFQYFISPIILQRKIGKHLKYLKELVNEME
jgi:hypothetical protein